MAGVKNPKYSKDEVSQSFNLKSILGYEPSSEQKEMFGDLVSDYIVDRTLSGKDINNRKFKQYSSEYAERKGVTRDSVNMTLTGDMLESIQDESDANTIKIKVGDGVDTLKAYNHNTGDTLPKRTFFGIKNEKQIGNIVSQVDQQRPARNALDVLKGITLSRATRGEDNVTSAFDILFGEDEQ